MDGDLEDYLLYDGCGWTDVKLLSLRARSTTQFIKG